MVYQIMHQMHGGWEHHIRTPPTCLASDTDSRMFLQFDISYTLSGEEGLSRMLGFGHPDLLFLLRTGPVNTFVDCTFRIVPKGFYQLMIIMIYSAAHQTYVPVLYILLQNKKEQTYLRALTEAEFAANHYLRPKTVTCDFEIGLMNAILAKFPSAHLIGCLFHFKQAIRRKLIKDFKVPSDAVSFLCGEHGLMNILCSIPIEDIVPFGISYIRSKMNQYEAMYGDKLEQFWKYFTRTWLNQYDPNHWNIHSIVSQQVNEEDILINRTNNALERNNRTLNTHFPSAHPNMVNFVTTLRQEANNYVVQLRHIQQGHRAPNAHAAPTIYEVPAEYNTFRDNLINPPTDEESVTESETSVSSNNNVPLVEKRRRRQQRTSPTPMSPILESSQEDNNNDFSIEVEQQSDSDVSVRSTRSGRVPRAPKRYNR